MDTFHYEMRALIHLEEIPQPAQHQLDYPPGELESLPKCQSPLLVSPKRNCGILYWYLM